MIALSFALALVAAPQETCGESDTACRIRELERRIEALERRPAGHSPSGGFTMELDLRCYDTAGCLREARAACTAAGFARGVPAQRRGSDRLGYTITQVTCTD